MDIFIPIAVIVIAFLMFSICGWCCKRHRQGTVYGHGGAPVTVTQQPVAQSSVVVPPYPVDARHPTPQMTVSGMAPPPGFTAGTGGYHQGGYPPASGAPYPGGAPYPPVTPYPSANSGAPYPPQTAPPPSYFEATQPAHQPAPTNELYAKQSPYNPNY